MAKDVLHGTGRETFEAIAFLKKARPEQYSPAAGAVYPRGRYGDSLKQIAQLLKADVGLEVAFTEIGGWDHHAAEGGVQGQLAGRLREFGQALAAFHRDLGDRMRDVVVVTLTEFGRTVRENGNRGTDHGHASVSFVMGGEVRGGRVHGRWPGLRDDELYEGRDLAVTTDFRDLLSEVLSAHLGARDLGRCLPRACREPGSRLHAPESCGRTSSLGADVGAPQPTLARSESRPPDPGAVRLDLLPLEVPPFRASPALPGIGALAPVPLPDCAPDVGGNVARASLASARRPRLRRRGQLPLLHVVQEKIERAIEDRRRVAVRDLAAQQVLYPSQLVVGLLRERELHPITLRSEVRDQRGDGLALAAVPPEAEVRS